MCPQEVKEEDSEFHIYSITNDKSVYDKPIHETEMIYDEIIYDDGPIYEDGCIYNERLTHDGGPIYDDIETVRQASEEAQQTTDNSAIQMNACEAYLPTAASLSMQNSVGVVSFAGNTMGVASSSTENVESEVDERRIYINLEPVN